MAVLEKKGVNPVVAVIANWFVLGILGYILLGQTSKSIKFLITGIIGSICCVIPGMIIGILGLVDVYQVAVAVENGEEVDEHEYKNALLFKICKIIDKDAICKAAGADGDLAAAASATVADVEGAVSEEPAAEAPAEEEKPEA